MKEFFTRKRTLLIGSIAVLTVILITVLGVTGVFSGAGNKNQRSNYNITASFNPDTMCLEADMTLDFYNTSGETLQELMMLLFPNAYSTQETAPFDAKDMASAYPQGFSAGGITVSDIAVNGKAAQSALSENGQQLTIQLGKNVGKGGSAKVTMHFVVNLPKADGRFGMIGNTVNLGNWYPIMAMRQNGEWVYTDYVSTGDPFFSEVADYKLSMTMPANYTFVGSASATKEDKSGNAVWTSSGKKLRDYACVLSSAFKKGSVTVGETTINCYYTENEAQAAYAMDSANKAIALFTELFGAYPYPEYNIVQTNFFIGGMEYPGLVMIDNSYFESGNTHALENVIVHETAHQWWYGVVGNNQISDAWIDEGLATYCTMLYYERNKDPDTYKMYFKYYITNGYRFSRDNARTRFDEFSEIMNRPLSSYEDAQIYNMLCYEKSAMMFQSVREVLGDDLFFANMRELYTSNQFGIVSQKEVLNALGRNTTKPAKQIIESWLSGKVYIP